MKNFVKDKQKLPLYGVGPGIVYSMAALTVIGIALSPNVLKSGTLNGVWILVFRISGGIFIILGASVWFIGALRSGMNENIANNKLKTDGIYSWVSTPFGERRGYGSSVFISASVQSFAVIRIYYTISVRYRTIEK